MAIRTSENDFRYAASADGESASGCAHGDSNRDAAAYQNGIAQNVVIEEVVAREPVAQTAVLAEVAADELVADAQAANKLLAKKTAATGKSVHCSISHAKQRELSQLQDEVVKLFDSSKRQSMAPQIRLRLRELTSQVGWLLGDPALTQSVQRSVEELHCQIDEIFAAEFARENIEADITRLEALYEQLDELLIRGELSQEQRQLVVEVEAHINFLVDGSTDAVISDQLIHQCAAELQQQLDAMFQVLDHIHLKEVLSDAQKSRLWEINSETFALLKQLPSKSLVEEDRSRLEVLLRRADKLMGIA